MQTKGLHTHTGDGGQVGHMAVLVGRETARYLPLQVERRGREKSIPDFHANFVSSLTDRRANPGQQMLRPVYGFLPADDPRALAGFLSNCSGIDRLIREAFVLDGEILSLSVAGTDPLAGFDAGSGPEELLSITPGLAGRYCLRNVSKRLSPIKQIPVLSFLS